MAVETQFLPILTRQASSRLRDFGRRPPPRSAPRCALLRDATRDDGRLCGAVLVAPAHNPGDRGL